MILYFSGTGNSRYVAEQLSERLGDELVSINEQMKKGEPWQVRSERPVVLVSPVYAWRMPRVVSDWVRRTEWKGSRRLYVVLTCGGDVGNAAFYAWKLCGEKKLKFCGLAGVVMPENFITLFDAPDEEEARQVIADAEPRIAQIAETIGAGRHLAVGTIRFSDVVKSSVVNDLFYPMFVSAGKYRATDRCVGCGKCERLCPLNNIHMREQKPVWGSACTQCMACICGCPEEAIEYGRRTKRKRRYWCKP